MNLEQIKKISFKERKNLVWHLCQFYKKNQQITKIQQKNFVEINKNNLFKNISIFEQVFSLLKKEHQEILKKYFLDSEKYHWTKSFYSKSTFYKVIHEAINNFLFLIYAN